MVHLEDVVDPIPDVIEFAGLPVAPAWKKIVERFRSIFQPLDSSFGDLPQPRTVKVDVMFQIHRLACWRILPVSQHPSTLDADRISSRDPSGRVQPKASWVSTLDAAVPEFYPRTVHRR